MHMLLPMHAREKIVAEINTEFPPRYTIRSANVAVHIQAYLFLIFMVFHRDEMSLNVLLSASAGKSIRLVMSVRPSVSTLFMSNQLTFYFDFLHQDHSSPGIESSCVGQKSKASTNMCAT